MTKAYKDLSRVLEMNKNKKSGFLKSNFIKMAAAVGCRRLYQKKKLLIKWNFFSKDFSLSRASWFHFRQFLFRLKKIESEIFIEMLFRLLFEHERGRKASLKQRLGLLLLNIFNFEAANVVLNFCQKDVIKVTMAVAYGGK